MIFFILTFTLAILCSTMSIAPCILKYMAGRVSATSIRVTQQQPTDIIPVLSIIGNILFWKEIQLIKVISVVKIIKVVLRCEL